jgi:hypothetical protein
MIRALRLSASIAAVGAALLALAAVGAQGSPAPAGAVATAATGPSGATGAGAPLTATLTACHDDALAANRYAVFASQMVAAAVPGTLTMAVEFNLEERSGVAPAFSPVDATGFDTWVVSQPHVGIFAYDHEVTALPAPASFRVLVRARWIGRHRRILRQTASLTPVCMEQLLAPDLAIGRIVRTPGTTPGTAQYSVEVHNLGNADAGAFQVTLEVGATVLPASTVPSLAAGATVQATFSGPSCPSGSTLTAAADPTGQVPEPADSRRTRTLTCPIP